MFFGLIQKVGSMGRYQMCHMLLWSIMGYVAGGIVLMTPFLFYQDPYQCPPDIPNCKDHVCAMAPESRASFVPTPTIRTLANHFGDYRCDE